MILVTGATGFVGRALVEHLVAAGEHPRCLVRDEVKAKKVLPAGVDVVVGNILHPATLATAFAGVDVVVDSSFMTAELKQHGEETYYNVNVSGTNNILDAAKRAGVQRIVVVSGLGTKADKPGTYMQGRYLAEEAVKQSGLGWSILQPSIQFGSGSAFFKGLADLIRQVPVVVPVAGTGKETFQPIAVTDVAICLSAMIRDPAHDGHSYPVGGPDIYTYNQILDILMDTLKIHKIKVPGPTPIVALAAGAMEALLPKPPITRAALELFKFPNTTTLDSVTKNFGFQPAPLKPYLAAHGVS